MLKSAFLLIAFLLASPAQAATPPAEGGSTQVGAQSGCVNQWMFNGVWRVRVTNVAFHPQDDGPVSWNVTMQWGNGTNITPLAPTDTLKKAMVLALANGDTLTTTDSTRAALNEQQLDFHSFPASGQFTYTQSFIGPNLDQNNKPAKLLITFDVASYKKNHPGASAKFWTAKTPGYDYRIDLTCSK
jgi:hypothetical protein